MKIMPPIPPQLEDLMSQTIDQEISLYMVGMDLGRGMIGTEISLDTRCHI